MQVCHSNVAVIQNDRKFGATLPSHSTVCSPPNFHAARRSASRDAAGRTAKARGAVSDDSTPDDSHRCKAPRADSPVQPPRVSRHCAAASPSVRHKDHWSRSAVQHMQVPDGGQLPRFFPETLYVLDGDVLAKPFAVSRQLRITCRTDALRSGRISPGGTPERDTHVRRRPDYTIVGLLPAGNGNVARALLAVCMHRVVVACGCCMPPRTVTVTKCAAAWSGGTCTGDGDCNTGLATLAKMTLW